MRHRNAFGSRVCSLGGFCGRGDSLGSAEGFASGGVEEAPEQADGGIVFGLDCESRTLGPRCSETGVVHWYSGPAAARGWPFENGGFLALAAKAKRAGRGVSLKTEVGWRSR